MATIKTAWRTTLIPPVAAIALVLVWGRENSLAAARAFFERWHAWAIRSRLRPMIHAAAIIRRHLDNVLNYINYPLTNAATEGLNAKIQWIKYSSRGFRNRERFKLAIYFHCGGLNLNP